MGNKQSLNSGIPIFREQEWEEVESSNNEHPQYGWYRTLRHVESGQLIDQYQIAYSDEQDYKFYLNSFVWRLKQPEIVRTMYLKEEHRQQFCSTTYSAKVYIEHIDTRVSDITDIPYPENLYVALCALDGFHKLHENLQYFKVEENQICVDQNGHVRVWIHSDLSKDYPNVDQDAQNGDETTMVHQIMSIVTENTDRDSQPESLKGYFFDRGSKIGFEDAKIIISEYARKHNAQIPECFESILEIYRKQDDSNMDEESDNMSNRAGGHLNTSKPLDAYGQTSAFPNEPNLNSEINNRPNFQPWAHNNQRNQQGNASSEARFRYYEGEVSLDQHRSYPNLHSFNNSGMQGSYGNRGNMHMGQGNISYNPSGYIKPLSSPAYNQPMNPLGFQPSYSPLPSSNSQALFVIPQRRQMIQTSPNYSRPYNMQSLPSKPSTAHVNRQNFAQYNMGIPQVIPELRQTKHSDKKPSNQQLNSLSNLGDEQVNEGGASKHSFKEKIEKSDVSRQNLSYRNLQDVDGHLHENQRVTVSNAFSQQNNKINNISRSRDVRTEENYVNRNLNMRQPENFIRIPTITNSVKHDSDKTYYYTLDTEQELDPEIAADLKKMFSNL